MHTKLEISQYSIPKFPNVLPKQKLWKSFTNI